MRPVNNPRTPLYYQLAENLNYTLNADPKFAPSHLIRTFDLYPDTFVDLEVYRIRTMGELK